MISLAARANTPEWMDADGLGFDEFEACLRDLERVNDWSLAGRPTLSWLERVVPAKRSVSILDVGSGRGDMLRRIARWARRTGRTVSLVGADLNPMAGRAAAAATPPDLPIRYETCDVFELGERDFDIVLSSLFAHHLQNHEVVRFLAWMDRTARIGWFINDLHRHWLPYWFLRGAFGALPLSPIVAHDGPVSVSRAFVRRDWDLLIVQAGLDPAAVEVRWRAPFRWGVGTRPGHGGHD